MSQAQDAILGNLPNGIVVTLANRYVTNVMNADPETKLLNGQQCTTEQTAFATCNMLLHDTLATGCIAKIEFHTSMGLSPRQARELLRNFPVSR